MLVAVTIRGNDFPDHSRQRKLLDTTDATGEICDTAKRLFVELRDGRTPLRLLGVSFEIVLQSVHSVGIINEQVSGIASSNS